MTHLAISAPPASNVRDQRHHDPDAEAVGIAFDAIEAVFTASSNPELTRQGLRGFVDMIADAQQQTPSEAIQALVDEYELKVEEWDPSALDEKLRSKFMGFYLESTDGRRLFVVPAGQDPAERLHALRALLAHQGVTA